MVNGRMIRKMAMVLILLMMAVIIMDSGLEGASKAKENRYSLIMVFTTENG